MDAVVYQHIPNHQGYRAGSDGSIWSCWRFQGAGYGGECKQVLSDKWRKLKGEPRKTDGRLRYTLRRNDGSYRRAYGSHFVLEAFVGPKPQAMQCCHNDGNCRNDAVANLRWDTLESNVADKLLHGTQTRGENSGNVKLTAKEVVEIRHLRAQGATLDYLAKQYGVTATNVSYICRRKVWKHV